MTEDQIKALCKWAVDNGKRPFTQVEKEAIKETIDQAQNAYELLIIALSAINKN